MPKGPHSASSLSGMQRTYHQKKAIVWLEVLAYADGGSGFKAPNVVQIPCNVKICVSPFPIWRDGDA